VTGIVPRSASRKKCTRWLWPLASENSKANSLKIAPLDNLHSQEFQWSRKSYRRPNYRFVHNPKDFWEYFERLSLFMRIPYGRNIVQAAEANMRRINAWIS
jgi:hypothetical protein